MEKIEFKMQHAEQCYIPLIQLLKAVNVVYSGSEAQAVVEAGLVRRNGQVELRKRAKITAGEIITFQQFEISVVRKDFL